MTYCPKALVVTEIMRVFPSYQASARSINHVCIHETEALGRHGTWNTEYSLSKGEYKSIDRAAALLQPTKRAQRQGK